MGLSEYDRILIKIKYKFKSYEAKRVFVNFPQKKYKNNSGYFLNVLMKTTTDRDENGIAERQEQLVQQRMSAMLSTLFSARKELPYTKQHN